MPEPDITRGCPCQRARSSRRVQDWTTRLSMGDYRVELATATRSSELAFRRFLVASFLLGTSGLCYGNGTHVGTVSAPIGADTSLVRVKHGSETPGADVADAPVPSDAPSLGDSVSHTPMPAADYLDRRAWWQTGWLPYLWDLVLTVVGVVLALWYESRGVARLRVAAEPTGNIVFTSPVGPPTSAAVTRLSVLNDPIRRWLVARRSSGPCKGTLSFRDAQGNVVLEIPLRWTDSAEPVQYAFQGNQLALLPDNSLIRLSQITDIAPDDEALLDVAVRFQGDPRAFAWNHECYLGNPRCHPLVGTRFDVTLVLRMPDNVVTRRFELHNPSNAAEFKILPT